MSGARIYKTQEKSIFYFFYHYYCVWIFKKKKSWARKSCYDAVLIQLISTKISIQSSLFCQFVKIRLKWGCLPEPPRTNLVYPGILARAIYCLIYPGLIDDPPGQSFPPVCLRFSKENHLQWFFTHHILEKEGCKGIKDNGYHRERLQLTQFKPRVKSAKLKTCRLSLKSPPQTKSRSTVWHRVKCLKKKKNDDKTYELNCTSLSTFKN